MRRAFSVSIDIGAIAAVSIAVYVATGSVLAAIGSQFAVMGYSLWCFYDGMTR